jgi:hypothetical protein
VAVTRQREPRSGLKTADGGFRPATRRRTRLLVGVLLGAAAVAVNLIVYSNLDARVPVLQVVRDVPAGSLISAEDLRAVEVAADPSVRAVEADQQPAVVGQYAKVRLISGSLVVREALQLEPLVAPGAAVVAVQVPDGALPEGLRERSTVHLVIPPSRTEAVVAPTVIPGSVVGLPRIPSTTTGRVSVSVEVDVDLAALVAASDDVRVILVEPADPVASAASSDP